MLDNNPQLSGLLVESINAASNAANGTLDQELYDLLYWPTTESEWISYIVEFSQWIPHQTRFEGWKDPDTGYTQEVYDRLCHFYYLIDQKVGPGNTTIVQNLDGFKEWLITYANLWGDFLNTTDSFNDTIWQSFKDYAPYYRIDDSLVNGKPNNPSGWLTFNQFFARELNPGLRPIAGVGNNATVVAPADCTYRKMYPIDKDSNINTSVLKGTHVIGNINDLLEGSPYANTFANGTFVHYFLGPYSYHRFHAPVSGLVKECRAVTGLTYLDVNITDKQFSAPDGSDYPAAPKEGYEFTQARGILTIDTTNSNEGNRGVVAIIPVGMCQVSGVHMSATVNNNIAKGEEFGYFLFGGSDIIMLFQEGQAPVIDKTEDSYRYYGTDISTAPYSKK
ncbi:phosphatidylserine decarboxylase [Lacinutrix sp. Bg11-31]|nr:phosphatidylserine decarboxylase [Lacinutrix sp. Bg11-31]